MRNFNNPAEVVKVPHRSGFDKSHFNLLTAKVGTLVPILVDEVIPNTKVHLRLNIGASMPPLAADTFMKCDVCVEAFFVPLRLLDGGFMDYFTQHQVPTITSTGTEALVSTCPPVIVIKPTDFAAQRTRGVDYFGPSTLLDYLGFGGVQLPVGEFNFSPYPLLAYHLLYQEYYRHPLIQREVFMRPESVADLTPDRHIWCAPYVNFYSRLGSSSASNYVISEPIANDLDYLADNVSIFELRQRNYGYDYFTNSFPNPQLGDSQVVSVSSNQFTISALRAANSLQQFEERNNIGGVRFNDALKARYGANLSNGMAQRPVLLGSAKYNVYSKSLTVTAFNMDQGVSFTQNPMAKYAGGVLGNAFANGSDLMIDGFTANEPGYIFCMASLVPTATYGTFFRRYLQHYISGHASIVDMANPLLQNTGYQPIYARELTSASAPSSAVFAYTDRYAEFMTHPDELHGLFRPQMNLEAFAFNRSFSGTPSLNSSFLKINTTDMDNVTNVSAELSQYGYWLQCQFDYKVSMPLAEYSIPSLQDPAYEHGDSIVVHRGGFRF